MVNHKFEERKFTKYRQKEGAEYPSAEQTRHYVHGECSKCGKHVSTFSKKPEETT